MSQVLDVRDPAIRATAVQRAAAALADGGLVVLPTDTGYALVADAFTPAAVRALARARGVGPDVPAGVLVGSMQTASGVLGTLSEAARDLAEAYWPGPLTLVARSVPHLAWDLGETRGTVAVRVPLHPVALEVLRLTGPLAASGAHRAGTTAALTVADACLALGDAVAVYLDAGPTMTDTAGERSTVVDVTGDVPRVLRPGVLDVARLRAVVPDLLDVDEDPSVGPADVPGTPPVAG